MRSMPAALIRFLALALLVAIPVQGMASVVAGQCMTFAHHEDGGRQDHAHAQDSADGHDHAAHSHSDGTAAQPVDEGTSAHCGPCTACCASASISSSAALSILSSPSNASYVFSQFPPLGFQPHGLDRPPLAL